MQVVILAGGFGTRLGEFTQFSPKPMIKIGKDPILVHIINSYASFGNNEFFIALGYKHDVIINYFFTHFKYQIVFKKKNYLKILLVKKNITLNLIYTGKKSMTGGRLLRLKNFITDKDFFMTYGDGIANIDLIKLRKFHQKNNRIATVTAVHPPARFGELKINNLNQVISFKEKPQINLGWINGGFFVFNRKIFKYIQDDTTILEKTPLEKITTMKQLVAYKHKSFWHCIDTRRDKDLLTKIYKKHGAFWLKKQ